MKCCDGVACKRIECYLNCELMIYLTSFDLIHLQKTLTQV